VRNGVKKYRMRKYVCTTLAVATLLAFLSGCSNALQKEVQTLTDENADLRSQVQGLKQEKESLQALMANQSALKIDYLDTTSSITVVNGEIDWRKYVPQKTFTTGAKDGLWVMFGFSNMLHDGKINVKADIYIISDGQLVGWKNNDATLTNSTFNNLYWGDSFDMSTFTPGEYDVLVTIHDIIAETIATQKTTFKIVNAVTTP